MPSEKEQRIGSNTARAPIHLFFFFLRAFGSNLDELFRHRPASSDGESVIRRGESTSVKRLNLVNGPQVETSKNPRGTVFHLRREKKNPHGASDKDFENQS